MSKVIMTCGPVCCGKSTYAGSIRDRGNAVILSVDDITLTMFPDGSGDMHDTYAMRAEKYLLELSLQIFQTVNPAFGPAQCQLRGLRFPSAPGSAPRQNRY